MYEIAKALNPTNIPIVKRVPMIKIAIAPMITFLIKYYPGMFRDEGDLNLFIVT